MVGDRRQMQQLDRVGGVGTDLFLLRSHAADAQYLFDEAGSDGGGTADDDVLPNCQAFEQRQVLQGPGHPELGEIIGWDCRELLSANPNLPVIRPANAADEVDDRAFSRPVWPDDRADLAPGHTEVHVQKGRHAAERQRELLAASMHPGRPQASQ